VSSGRLRMLLGAAVRRRADLGPLVRALWLLPWTTARLRGRRGSAVAQGAAVGHGERAVDARQLARARRLQRVVAIASAHGVATGTCLSRSLTLLDLLQRERLPAALRIGVRGTGGDLEAHAWVECAGVVLNDAPDVADRYAAFAAGARR